MLYLSLAGICYKDRVGFFVLLATVVCFDIMARICLRYDVIFCSVYFSSCDLDRCLRSFGLWDDYDCSFTERYRIL